MEAGLAGNGQTGTGGRPTWPEDVGYDCANDIRCARCDGAHRCATCGRHKLLLRGQCVTVNNCINEGRVPVVGDFHKGGKCLPDGI